MRMGVCLRTKRGQASRKKVAGVVEQTSPAYFLAGLEGREQQTEPGAYLVYTVRRIGVLERTAVHKHFLL